MDEEPQGRIEGSYPGGPRRRDPDEPPPPPRAFERAEDVEARLRAGKWQAQRRQRRWRVRLGLVVAVIVSGAAGVLLGLASHRTTEDLTAEREEARTSRFDPSQEVNRMLLELWRMEDVELAPRPPGGLR